MSIPDKMKAIGFTRSLAITEPNSLLSFTTDVPTPGDHDLLVQVTANGVNPVDTKVRSLSAQDKELDTPTILGYDAVGTVVAKGAAVQGFNVGDRVYYAGDVSRPGTNAQYHTVDYRIAARAPESLSDTEAAALPLTTLTAWEALFDRLRVDPTEHKTLLIIGGAGGVGSMAIQLAKQLTNLTVIATASRPESTDWVKQMGADATANHHQLVDSVRDAGFHYVDYIFNVSDTVGYWQSMAELIAPQGMICSIVEFDGGVDLSLLQGKAAGFIWELMFTRPLHKTDDMATQHDILFQVANLIDCGRIKTTLTQTLHGLEAETFRQAHQQLESGKTIGKVAVSFTE